eukprot:929761-Pleurochrysis_carterae.AAC.1
MAISWETAPINGSAVHRVEVSAQRLGLEESSREPSAINPTAPTTSRTGGGTNLALPAAAVDAVTPCQTAGANPKATTCASAGRSSPSLAQQASLPVLWSGEGYPTSCVLRGLEPTTRYAIRVRALNAAGASSWGDVAIGVTASGAPSPPAAPVVFAKTSTTMSLRWGVTAAEEAAAAEATAVEATAVEAASERTGAEAASGVETAATAAAAVAAPGGAHLSRQSSDVEWELQVDGGVVVTMNSDGIEAADAQELLRFAPLPPGFSTLQPIAIHASPLSPPRLLPLAHAPPRQAHAPACAPSAAVHRQASCTRAGVVATPAGDSAAVPFSPPPALLLPDPFDGAADGAEVDEVPEELGFEAAALEAPPEEVCNRREYPQKVSLRAYRRVSLGVARETCDRIVGRKCGQLGAVRFRCDDFFQASRASRAGATCHAATTAHATFAATRERAPPTFNFLRELARTFLIMLSRGPDWDRCLRISMTRSTPRSAQMSMRCDLTRTLYTSSNESDKLYVRRPCLYRVDCNIFTWTSGFWHSSMLPPCYVRRAAA